MFSFKELFKDKKNITDIEDILFEIGISPEVTNSLLENVNLKQDVENILQDIKRKVCEVIKYNQFSVDDIFLNPNKKIFTLCGNNGSGKTTFIGKFINFLLYKNLKVHVVAADTFRAAAVEQIEHFAKKFNCTFSKGADQDDPSSVIFKALEKNQDHVVLIDTSGRQHNNINLMEQLKKIDNTVSKFNEFQKYNLLSIDANTGLAAPHIVEGFMKYIHVDGLIINKVDSNKQYGMLLSILFKNTVDIYFEGVGESEKDLRSFDFHSYIDNMFFI